MGLFPVVRRCFAKLFAETAGEVIETVETYGQGNFAHITVALTKQVGSTAQTQQSDKFVGSLIGQSR